MNDVQTIAGVTPREVVTPRDLDELAATVRELHAARKPFAFAGGGTELELGNAPTALDTVVRTTKLDRVVDYTPEDQTITVEAGMTFAALDQLLAIYGQMLPLDVADREHATLGGAIATNAYGRRRQRYGTAKDLIVGVQMVRPDGVLARGGGKVVKNVAGFDLPKLMVGSLGTLGAIAAVTLRVHPLPEATRTVRIEGYPDDLAALIVRERLEPESVVVYRKGAHAADATCETVVTFTGLERGVAAQVERLRAAIPQQHAGGALDAASDDDVRGYAASETRVRTAYPWLLRVAMPPSAMGNEAWTEFVPGGAESLLVQYPAMGLALAAGNGFVESSDPPECVRRVRRASSHAVVARMPLDLRGTIDAWGPPPASLPLMRAIKANFDPLGLCNPGRFIGGL